MLTFAKINADVRFSIAVSIGFLVFYVTEGIPLQWLAHLLFAYVASMLSLLVMCWVTFFTTTASELRQVGRKQDENRAAIFVIILSATLTSLVAVILITTSEGDVNREEGLEIAISTVCLFVSWMILHTVFALRYAHLYYGDSPDALESHCGGLQFPGETPPDYLDFAYFSFVIGMTFQVSDVEIVNQTLRRLTLLHSLLAFGYNTVLVALTINLLASLGK